MNLPNDILDQVLSNAPRQLILSGMALLIELGWEAFATHVNEHRSARRRAPLLPVLWLGRKRAMEQTGWGSDAEWFRPSAYLGVIAREPLSVIPWLIGGSAFVIGYFDLAMCWLYSAAAWRFLIDWILAEPHANPAQKVGYAVVKILWCATSGLFFAALFVGGFFYGIIFLVLFASMFFPIFANWSQKGDDDE